MVVDFKSLWSWPGNTYGMVYVFIDWPQFETSAEYSWYIFTESLPKETAIIGTQLLILNSYIWSLSVSAGDYSLLINGPVFIIFWTSGSGSFIIDNSKKNLYFYCFVTFFHFFFEEWCKYTLPSEFNMQKLFLVGGLKVTDEKSRMRIRNR